MPYSEAGKKAVAKYKEKNYSRIVIDLKTEAAEAWKAEAEKRGETVAGFVKKAVEMRIKSESDTN